MQRLAETRLKSDSDGTVTALVDSLPHYEMCRKKLEIPSQDIATQLIARAEETYTRRRELPVPQLDMGDGIKRIWDDRWVNIRKSGTEPVIRVFSEAPTVMEAEALCDETLETLELLMKQICR